MQAPSRAPNAQPVKIYNAVYSSVQVYECMIRGIAVMRRRSDSYVNATQILKVAGVDKGRRTKILEKEILTGKHEIVQGGYGKYQGTWIPLEKGRELAVQFGVSTLLAPLFDFTPSTQSLQALPVSTPLFSALSALPSRTSPYPSFSGSPTFPGSPSQLSSPRRDGTPGPNPLAPPPIMPGSALRLLNQGRAQGLFTPSTSILHQMQAQSSNQAGPSTSRPPSSQATPTPPPIGPSAMMSPGPTPAPTFMPTPIVASATPGSSGLAAPTPATPSMSIPAQPTPEPTPTFQSLKRARENEDMMAEIPSVLEDSPMLDVPEPSPAKRPRITENGTHPIPKELPLSGKATFFTSQAARNFESNGPMDLTPHRIRYSTKVSNIYTRDPTPLKDQRRANVANMICAGDDAPAILEALRGVGNAGLTYVSPNNENTFDPDTPLDPQFHTALHLACSLSRINTISLMLANQADAHKGNQLGETPLMRALISPHAHDTQSLPSILSLLGETIWTLDSGGRSILHHICAFAGVKGRSHIARYYIDTVLTHIASNYSADYRSLIDVQDEHGDTALIIAARAGNRGIVRCFLDVGVNVSLMNKLGLRAGDFGVEVEELNSGSRSEDVLSMLRAGPPVPVQKSQDVIADMTTMIQGLSSDFQAEIKTKQDALDVTQAHLRAATRELSEQRRQIQIWQQRCGELDQTNQRVRNLERAIKEEDLMEWTGRTRPPTPPPSYDSTMANGVKEDEIKNGSAFVYRGRDSVLGSTESDNMAVDSIEADPPIPTDNSVETLVKLRRMRMWYGRVEEMTSKRLSEMKGESAEKEFICRKIVALCTGLPVQDVDKHLDNLLIALESENQIADIGRVSGFMQKVRDGVL